MSSPPLDVLIATHGRPDLLARTLDSLAACRLPSALRRVLVVENGSRAGAEEVCGGRRERLPVHYLYVEEGSKSKALNAGLDALAPGLVYFVDDDVRLSPRAPEEYLEAATRYGPGHHFGGPVHVDRDDEPPEWLRPYLPATALGWYAGDRERYYDRPNFIGSNWAAFRDDILEVGGYAEHLGPGTASGAIGDEMELQQRLLAAGNRGVYLPEAEVWHHVSDREWSFEWARRRQYRMAVTRGLIAGARSEEALHVAGAPLRRWRDLLEYGAKVLVGRTLGWSSERRVHPEMRLQESLGAIVGSRLAGRRERAGSG